MRGEGTPCVHSPAPAQGRAQQVPGFSGGLPAQPHPAPQGPGGQRGGHGRELVSRKCGIVFGWKMLTVQRTSLKEQEHHTTAGCLQGPCPEHSCGVVVAASPCSIGGACKGGGSTPRALRAQPFLPHRACLGRSGLEGTDQIYKS